MIQLVVFDWNGTLIADAHACMAADNHVLSMFDGRTVDFRTYQRTIIIPAIQFYVAHGCDEMTLMRESQRLGDIFHEYYEPRAAKVRTRRGARQLLLWLYGREVRSVILSNHTVKGIRSQLQRLRLEKYFSEVLANDALDTSMKGRNKQEKLKRFFNECGLHPSEVLIIGDSPEEVEMGRSIGITTVAITGGYYERRRLVESHPDHLIQKPSDLIAIIEAIR